MSTVPDLATLDDLLAHAGWTRALAVRLLGDPDEADDVLQETWLNALKLPPERRRALRPWLATVVRNLVRSRARSQARARQRARQATAERTVPSSEELLSQLQTERLIAAMVLELPEPYRHTIILRYHHGQSSAEIARAEQIPDGTVRWRLKYGLDELRRRFDERAGGREVARGMLLPFAAAATAVTAAKGALAAPALLLSGKALVAAATLAVVAAGGTTLVQRQHRTARTAAAPARTMPPRVTTAATTTAAATAAVAPAPPAPSASTAVATGPALPAPPAVRALLSGWIVASQGQPAAAVPVALRPVGLAGPAGRPARARATVTDRSGRFRFADLPSGRFVITADLPEDAGAQLTIDVRGVRGGGSVNWTITPGSHGAATTVEIRIGRAGPGAPLAVAAPIDPSIPSRWCCRRALVVGDYVEGRACLRLPATSSGRECQPYRLQREVHCLDDTFGNFATGDLRRTGRLVCEGLAL